MLHTYGIHEHSRIRIVSFFSLSFLASSRARAVRACDTKRLQLKYLFRMVKLFQQIVHF